jgi:hypothetical protein
MNDQFSAQKLGASYWFVTHKLLIKNIIAIVFIIIAIFIIAYNLYLLIFNLALFREGYSAILSGYTTNSLDYSQLRQTILPQQIEIGQIETFANKASHDIVIDIKNPNTTWWATFDYQIRLGQELTDNKKGFILPGETKTIVSLAVEDGDLANQVVLSNIKWTKEINFASIKNDRFKFDIQNINYIPAKELGVEDEVPISRLEFDVINQSAYNYRNVNFYVFLNSGAKIVAINQLYSGRILSGQTNDLEITFFQNLPNISSAEVIAEVNFLDDNSFLQY